MSFFLAFVPAFMLGAVAIMMAVYLQQNNAQYQISSSNYGKKSPKSASKSTTPRTFCKICGSEIVNLEVNLTKLPCNHEFHAHCISSHYKRYASQENGKVADCPALNCDVQYSLSL